MPENEPAFRQETPEPAEDKPTPEQQLQLLALRAFLINNSDRIKMWQDSHSKDGQKNNYPLYWDPSRQEFVWINRKQRRK